MKGFFKTKFSLLLIAFISILIIFATPLTSFSPKIQAQEPVVLKNNDSSQTQSFQTIQAAIDYAKTNSWNNITITLGNSAYTESVVIDDATAGTDRVITIDGQGTDSTQIVGNLTLWDYNGVTVNNLVLKGFIRTGNRDDLFLNAVNQTGDIFSGDYTNITFNNTNLTSTVFYTGNYSGIYLTDTNINASDGLGTGERNIIQLTNSHITGGGFSIGNWSSISINGGSLTIGGAVATGDNNDINMKDAKVSINGGFFSGHSNNISLSNSPLGANVILTGQNNNLLLKNSNITIRTDLKTGNSNTLYFTDSQVLIENDLWTGDDNLLDLKNSNIIYGNNFYEGLNNTISLDATSSIRKKKEKFVYVALGDSYQAGEGAGNSLSITDEYLKAYENGSNYPQPDGQQSNTYTSNALAGGDGCHRSLANYAKINRKKLRPDLTDNDIVLIDVTCSGAKIEPGDKPPIIGISGSDLYASPSSQIAVAIDQLHKKGYSENDVDFITVGMGGNDARFSEVVAACLTPNLIRYFLDNYTTGGVELGSVFSERAAILDHVNLSTCKQAIEKIDNFKNIRPGIDSLAEKEGWAQNILLKTFTKARIMQLNYPSFIPKLNNPAPWCGGIDKRDFEYANSLVTQIDNIIGETVQKNAAIDPRIEVINIKYALGIDPLCSDTLVNGLSEYNFNAEVIRLLNDAEVRSKIDKIFKDYNDFRPCIVKQKIHLCSNEEYDTRSKLVEKDVQNLADYLSTPDKQQTIFANLAAKPIQGSENEGIRYDRSRGFFHPNANGYSVIACNVLAAFRHTNTENCLSAKSPIKDLVNNLLVQNAPINSKPGDQMHIQFGGFASNAPVRIMYYSNPIDLGTAMSNDNGVVDTFIKLPDALAGVHTLELKGNTPGGIGMHKRVRVNYQGRPLGNDSYSAYICGFTPASEDNIQSDQVDIIYSLDKVFATLTPDEDGCVLATVPVVDQQGAITINAKSQTTGKSVTTTIDPIPSVVGLWADSNKSQALLVTGADTKVSGLVHSNADITVRGSRNEFTGGVEYATAMTVTGAKNNLQSSHKVEAGGQPLVFKISEYQPNGSRANKAGSNYHIIPKSACVKGVWNILANKIPNGIVYVPCAIVISGSNANIKATIVADGSIQLKGANINVDPGDPGDPALLTEAANSNSIRIDGSNIKINGTIQALNGETRITGAKGTYHCGIIAKTIAITGSNINVPVDDQCSPQ